MKRITVKLLSATAALFFGSGLTSVYALTETDFTNTGIVVSAPTQFENNEINNDSAVVVLPKGLVITKAADASALSTPTQVGDIVSYTITVENIGLLGLTGVSLADTIIPASDIVLSSGDLNSDGVLDHDEVWIYSGDYAITQADIDSFGGGDGDIDNTVTVTSNELLPASDSVEVAISQSPNFAIEKSVDLASITDPSLLTYTIEITNTGNLTLNGVSISDTLPDGSSATLSGPSNDIGLLGALDVGETWTYTTTYNALQTDVDNGSALVNTVVASTTETTSTVKTDTAETTIVQAPTMLVSKTVDTATISQPSTLNYTITVENTGNVTLNNVLPVDELPNGNPATLAGPVADTGIVGSLDVGEVWTYTTSYSAPQSDIDAAAALVNIVTVTSDETAAIKYSDSAITAVDDLPSMAVTKNVDIASLDAPNTLSYTIDIENTGNVSLSDLSVVDVLPNGSNGVVIGPLTDTGLVGQLDVGETWNFTTDYQVSQAEIDLGFTLINAVSVTSLQTGSDVASDTASTILTRIPSYTVDKSVDLANITEPGLLNYEITVSNTGNTSLTDIQLSDTLPDGSQAVLTGPVADVGLPGALDVGESWTYLGEYLVTQLDMDAGTALTNSVSVSTAEAGVQEDTAVTTVSQSAGISIAKQSENTDFTIAGDVVSYTLTIVNTGNVQLTNILVSDPLADSGSLSCETDNGFVLLPTEQVICTVTQTIDESHVAQSNISNQAFVTATDTTDNTLNAASEVVVVPMLAMPPVAISDLFESLVSAVAITLPGSTNDTDANNDLLVNTLSFTDPAAVDSNGDGYLDNLVVAGEGSWVVNSTTGEVTFTPESGFTADPTPINYTVSDATGLVSNEASLTIDYPQSAPVAKDDYKENTQVESPTNPTTLNVLSDNGSGPDTDPENDIDISSINLVSADAIDTDNDGDSDTLVVQGEGVWVVNNATAEVTFTPAAGYLSDPTPIVYTVSDINGLMSNEATITVDYPQTAPTAVDDEKLLQLLAQPVTLAVLSNDTDPENNIDPASVMLIDPANDDRVSTLVVDGEGTWSVDPVTGDITFTPEVGFIDNPAVINYTVKDTTGLESNLATVTVTFEAPATLEGIVWIDSDRDGEIGENEQRKAGWTLKVYDDAGRLVATTTTDETGYYNIPGLVPGAFVVEFFNEFGVYMDRQETDGVVGSGQVVNLPLPVDPGGVVYDSISREAVEGVTLTMINGSGDLLHPDCLYANQQSQVTPEDGLYAFNINPGAHASCPPDGAYRIQIASVPNEYHPNFSSIIRQEGAGNCGDAALGCAVSAIFESDITESNCTIDSLPGTNACEVQAQPDAPNENQDTVYFVEFFIQPGDRNVIFNHLPIDAKANDSQILLSKIASKREVSVGSLVEYTLTAENTKDVPATDVSVMDTPPANFSLVSSSINLVRSGDDGEFGTEDDTVLPLNAEEASTIVVEAIDLEPLEIVQIKYLMRIGVGVVPGKYVNEAVANRLGELASNSVNATVVVVPDPVLEQATLVGKVFNDRDADGTQDPAAATGVALRSDYYGWNSLDLPSLPGRDSVTDDPAEHAVTVNMPVTDDNRFMIVTKEGTRISVGHDGTISEAHVGDKARGLNAQDIRVCTQLGEAIPTGKDGNAEADGVSSDVLKIVVQNFGLNEQGIPGVRLATVTGLLIETDAYGRYSIPDVEAGSNGIGQNFVLKVDSATLPQGAQFTTENPYVLRILNASLNKINFGVSMPEVDPYKDGLGILCEDDATNVEYRTIQVDLGSVFFDVNEDKVRDDQRGIVADIINKLREYGGGEIVIEAHTDATGSAEYNMALSERRAQSIRAILEKSLGSELMERVSIEVSSEAYAEQEK